MSWLSILFMLNQSRRNKKPKEQNNGKERMVNKCHYSPCESKLTQTFQSEFSICLNLSQNFQFNLHIDFTYLLFRSKEIIYLCQKKKKRSEIPRHTRKAKKHTTALRQWWELCRAGSHNPLEKQCGSSLLW